MTNSFLIDSTINLVLADRSRLFLTGLHQTCATESYVRVFSLCQTMDEVFSACQVAPIDIIIIDSYLDKYRTESQLIKLQESHPHLKIILINHSEKSVAQEFKNGLVVSGLLSEFVSKEELLSSIQLVSKNGYAVCSDLKKMAVDKPNGRKVDFSEIELKIINFICQDYSSKEIAVKSGINIRTVESVRSRLFKKVGVKSIAGLAIYAMENQLISSHPKSSL